VSKSPAFQFYPKDWLGDPEIMLMDWDAKAMHLHCICIAWTQSDACSLPDDDEVLRKWLQVSDVDDWEKRLKKQIFSAWKLENGRWVQSRLKREKNKQLERSEKMKNAAEKRWNKEQCKSNAKAMQKQCSSSSSSSSSTNTHTLHDMDINKKQKGKTRDPDLETADFIWKHVDGLAPGQKKPNMETWANDIRKMREIDKRPLEDIKKVFLWAHNDEFWKANIRSPAKLRKQFDALNIKRANGHETSQRPNPKKYPESRSARADRIWRERNGGEAAESDGDQLRGDIQSGAGLSASAESVGEILDGEFTREKS